MKPANNISEELESLAPALIPALGIQVYSVPDGYFELFPLTFYPDKILNPEPAMTVPEGYFDGFADSVLTKIRAAETGLPDSNDADELPVVLRSMDRSMPYEIPAGYMGSLAGRILKKIHPAKVIAISAARRSVFRYAAAAVITGLLGLGIFNGMNNKPNSVENDGNVVLADATQILSANSFEQTLESIPAEDIVNYLENIGQDVDAAIVAAAASQADLPEPVDYLLDEETLDKFLDEINM